MALDKLTKIDGGGISTTSDYRVGVITATKFVGPVEGSITATDASFSGNVSIAGTLTYEDVTNVDSVGILTARTNIILGDSLKHLGDENTLISFPANDTITAHTSGSERLRISSTGRVAIGTDNTTSATGLTVYRDDTGIGNIVNIEQDGTGDAVLGFAIKGTAAWQFGIDNSDSDKFKISYDGSGLDSSTSVTLDRTGKVGIGTNNPLSLLSLFSDAAGEELLHFDMGSATDRRGWKFKQGDTGTLTELVLQADSNGKSFSVKAANGAECFFVHTSSSGAYVRCEPSLLIGDTIQHIGDSNTKIRFPAADTITAETGGSERVRITSGGRVLIGHDTLSSDLHDPQNTINRSPFVQLHGANCVNAGAALISWKNSAGAYYAPALYLAHSGSDTKGTNGILPAGGEFGSIVFSGDDGTDFVKGAMIKARLDGTPGNDDMPGRLEFHTTPDGAQVPVERLRITAGGNVGINTNNPTAKLEVNGDIYVSDKIATRQFPSNSFLDFDDDNDPGVFGATGSNYVTLASISGINLIYDTNDNDGNGLVIAHGNPNSGNATAVLVTGPNGEVGINTDSPAFLLDVVDNAIDAEIRIRQLSTSSSADTILRHSIAGTTASNKIYFGDANDVNAGEIKYDHSDDSMQFTAGANERLRIASNGNVGINQSNPSTTLDVSGNANITGTLEAKAFRFGDSLVKKISVDYFGSSYLVDGEYQEILTITPSANSQNYSIIGKITANGGTQVQTIDVNIALRSNTRPNLNIAGTYTSTILGTVEHITPRLLLQTTGTTGSFKLFVEVNNQINGSITANLDVITRGEAQLNDIVVNTTSGNEVTSLPAGYTVTTPTKIYQADDGDIAFNGNVGINQSNPSTNLDVSGNIKLTAQLMQSMPSDFWSQGNTFIELNGVGNLTHMGSYETCLTSNGYRDNNAQWKSYAVNSNAGASQIRLNPAGYIIFGTEASKSDGSAHNVTERLRIASDGDVTITGNDNAELKLKCGTSTGNNIIAFLNSSGTTRGNIFYDSDNNFMVFKTNGTASSNERLRITSDGKVGINSTSPQAYLDIEGDGNLAKFGSTDSSYEALYIKNNVSGYPAITNESSPDTIELRSAGSVQVSLDYNNNDTDKYFRVVANEQGPSGTEVFRVQENGCVGIGTASIATNKKLDVCNGIVSIQGTGSHDSRIEFVRPNTGSLGWMGIPNWNPDGFYIYVPTATSNEAGASYGDGTWNFFSNGVGPRLKILSSGNVQLTQNIRLESAPNGTWGAGLNIGGNGQAVSSTHGSMVVTNGNLHLDSRDGSYGVYLNWYGGGNGTYFGNGAGGQRGRIDGAGNLTLSGNYPGSDLRLKENIQNISGATDTIKSLVGKTFTWKTEAGLDDWRHYGFIAQEVQTVAPDLVKPIGCHYFDKDDNLVTDIEPTESDEDRKNKGITQSLTVNNEGVTPILVEAMKELIAKVETLEAKVSALEGS